MSIKMPPHLAQEDVSSLALDIFDHIVSLYPDYNIDSNFDVLDDLIDKHLDRFSIGYRNYN